MFKGLNKSLMEAFKLVEDDEMGVADATPVSDIEETSETASIDERITNLENEISEIKDTLINNDVVDDFTASTQGELSYQDNFENQVYECFMKHANLSEDVEITEDLLNKRPYADAYIPSVASKTKTTSKNVKSILLNRNKGNKYEA